MVLSRFWIFIFIFSIGFVIFDLFSNQQYSIDFIINGKKDDPILVAEHFKKDTPEYILSEIEKSENKELTIKGKDNVDTLYVANNNTIKVYAGKQKSDGLLATAKSSLIDLIIPLIAYLALFCGLMELLIVSGASEKLAQFLNPAFRKIFPSLPSNHPSLSYMTLNFAANLLGLDSAATPFGLKAMESLQELNTDKSKASDAQIMFMCLHAAGLTLIPTSIIGYRAAENASNPADVVLPCIITSLVGTLVAFIFVAIKQRIRLISIGFFVIFSIIIGGIVGFILFINSMNLIEKNVFTSNFSGVLLLLIIFFILVYAFIHEKKFTEQNTNIFDTFVRGANNGLKTGKSIFPYALGMLVAISLFRNSGLFEIISNFISTLFSHFGVAKEITDSFSVALLRPFSSSGSRGFMIDSMRTYGVDSLTGRLACIFQSSAETTFYVIAVYFGAINIRNIRYTLGVMLLVDLACVVTAIIIASLFF